MRNIQKQKTVRDASYLAWIRTLDCTVCHRPGQSVAHHEGSRGMGIKASDRATVPLCPKCHHDRHQQGKVTFWAGTDIEAIQARLNNDYEKARGK